jgi:hypothetical protein
VRPNRAVTEWRGTLLLVALATMALVSCGSDQSPCASGIIEMDEVDVGRCGRPCRLASGRRGRHGSPGDTWRTRPEEVAAELRSRRHR